MIFQVPEGKSADVLVKKILYLAWKASSVFGMGILQDKGPNQNVNDVWNSTCNRDDYSGMKINKPGEIYSDYVMGRMMKLRLEWNKESITISEDWRDDYQSFCNTYKTPQELFDAALKE